LRETNPDSTNPDGFDYGARIIAEQTSMGLPRTQIPKEFVVPGGAKQGGCKTL